MKLSWVLGVLALLVALAGCTQQVMEDEHMEGEWAPEEMAAMEKEHAEKEAMMEGEWAPEEMAAMEKEHAEKEAMMEKGLLAGDISKYYVWDKAMFDQAVADGKIVYLEFSAEWCPACQQQEKDLKVAFEQLDDPDVVGFRIPYKDSRTTEEHTLLAKQYGIAYQHTKVIIKGGKTVMKSPEAWSVERFLSEMKRLG
jgi:thiol-disulfide isomerase/thioredoxin